MEVTLKIDELKPSASNVRSQHMKKDVIMMADSIKMRGIINPPCVAKNGDGKYEVVAGLLRYRGAVMAGVDTIRCLDVTTLTPTERVEISLSENVDRRQMSAMEYHAAFNKLFKAGMTVPTIASRFKKTERRVQQLLAIGSLPKKILDLADAEEIGDRTLEALAIANGKDVVRYGKLTAKERPNDWDIQKWLAGDTGMFLEKHALFDDTSYKGPKVTDLFGDEDEVWLMDGKEFWRLQNICIKADLGDFEQLGWKTEQVDYFQPYQWDKIPKAKGGMVIYTVDARSGRVEYHKGYGKKKGTGKAPAPDNKDGAVAKKPDTSQAFNAYMAETRHSAVRRQMIDAKLDGMIAVVVLLLKQPDNISMGNQGSAVKNEAQLESMGSDSNNLAVFTAYADMLQELKIKDGMAWDIKTPALVKKLCDCNAQTLIKYISTIMAYRWHIVGNGDESNAIGRGLGLKVVNIWEADDAFWDGINNKATLIAIAKENSIPIDEKATSKVIRKILQEKTPDAWRPSWLKF